MARARKSHKRDEEKQKTTRSGIQPPYNPQPGKDPYVVYCDYTREEFPLPKVLVLHFAQLYSAKYFVDSVIGDDSWEWADDIGSRSCIRTPTGIRLSMFDKKDLKDILAYEPTAEEAEWEDEQVQRHVQRFKFGRAERGDGSSDSQSSEDTKHTDQDRRGRKDKERVPKPERVKIDKTGLISANDIAQELGCEGREVRGVLRAMKLEKPAGGWLFDKKTADDIRDKVKKGLKKK